MTPAPLPRGLAVYAPISDGLAPDALVGRLRACGASIAVLMVEGLPIRGARGQLVTPRLAVPRYAAAVARLRAHGIEAMACSFPQVSGDLVDALAHLRACAAEAGTHAQLDAEPYDGAHWSPSLLRPWLDALPEMSITSTRAELPVMGRHGRETWLQLESQTSTDTLDAALAIAARYTAPERIVPVCGVFDTKRDDGTPDPRTPDEIRRDLERCTPQARASGRLGEWSSRSLTAAKMTTLRTWVESRPLG